MGINKIIWMSSLLVFWLLVSCVNPNVLNADYVFSDVKKSIVEQVGENDMFVHFPENITSDCLGMRYTSPSEGGSDCIGDLYLTYGFDESLVEQLTKDSILYYTEYRDSANVIINMSEFRRNIFPIKKCNKWFCGNYPIPYFENFDFGLGEHRNEKIVDGVTYWDCIYTVPNDLRIFVISARSGKFWKKECDENRLEILKEWKNGYSSGIAITKENNKVIYWAMIW